MARPVRIPHADAAFLRHWSPARFAGVGMLVYLASYALSALQYDYSLVSLEAFGYAALVLTGFFGGTFAGDRYTALADPPTPQPQRVSPDTLINVTAWLGVAGVALRIYDRFFLRGFTITENYLENRESISETTSFYSYIGGTFFCFGMVSLALIWLTNSQQRRPAMFFFVSALAIYPMAEALLQGSRSTMLHTAFLVFMFARSSNALPWLVRSWKALLVLGIVMIVLVQLIYEVRSLQGTEDIDIVDVFKRTEISRYATPPDWVSNYLIEANGEGIVAEVLKAWVHASQYLTHSWLAYCVSYDNFRDDNGWGRIHFQVPMRVLSTIVGEDLTYDPALYGLEAGLSSTVFSLIYYDFGALGPLIAFFFGFIASQIHRRAILYPERWLPVHAYVCFACLAMMIDNQLIGGLGTFAVWAFLTYVPLNLLLNFTAGRADDEVEAEPTLQSVNND